MNNWKSFFKSRLTQNGSFTFEGETHKGSTDRLIFKSSTNETVIEVGILDDCLITLEIQNPRTPGFNEQQRREYFYRNDFHPTKSYGDPGLEFISQNIEYFEKLFKEGLEGKEIQYYKGDRLIESEVYLTDDSSIFIPIRFEQKGFWKSLIDFLAHKKGNYDSKTEIALKEIFGGMD